MQRHDISSVTVRFDDGHEETFDLPKESTQRFIRTGYTWESTNEKKGLAKWNEKLYTFEIFWAVKNNVSI